MVEVIPTNTCPPDVVELSRRSAMFARFSEWVQLDVSDGIFTAERSWPYGEGQWAELEALADEPSKLPSAAEVKYEAHLMVEEPREIGLRFAQAGIRRIIGHIEAFADEKEIRGTLDAWRGAGARQVGLAILLDTPLPVLLPVIPVCDVVQVMSIAVLGRQGAPFDARVIARIQEIHARHPDLVIAVDGGVAGSNIGDLVRAGATRFGVGSAITKAEDPKLAYETLKSTAESALDPVR